MLLIITNKKDYTADFVISDLIKKDVPYFRFNTEDFPNIYNIMWDYDNIKIKYESKTLDLKNVDAIWYRKPINPEVDLQLDKKEREFVVREIREALSGIWKQINGSWVNHPDKITNASNKLHQLQTARKIGFLVPETIVTNDVNQLIDFIGNGDVKEYIIKPIHSGLVDEETSRIVFTNKLDISDTDKLRNIKYCPSIVQEYIKKEIDVRVTIFGDQVFSTAIYSQNNINTLYDWRKDNMLSLKHKPLKLPNEIEEMSLKLLEYYDLKYGAFDFVKSRNGDYFFIELNPNGQWAWIEHLTKQPMREALINLLLRGE